LNYIPSIFISPNPFTTTTLANYLASFEVQLFDKLGRVAPLQYYSRHQGSQTILTIDRSVLWSVFISITSREKREVAKVMLE